MTQFSSGKHRPLTNPANGVLGRFRGRLRYQELANNPSTPVEMAGIWLRDLMAFAHWEPMPTDAEVAHARAVLSRLARLADAAEPHP